MSAEEEDQEQQIVKEPEREPEGRRFFISHLNSYTGRALARELNNEHLVREAHALHTFCGTLHEASAKIETVADLPQQVELVSMERT